MIRYQVGQTVYGIRFSYPKTLLFCKESTYRSLTDEILHNYPGAFQIAQFEVVSARSEEIIEVDTSDYNLILSDKPGQDSSEVVEYTNHYRSVHDIDPLSHNADWVHLFKPVIPGKEPHQLEYMDARVVLWEIINGLRNNALSGDAKEMLMNLYNDITKMIARDFGRRPLLISLPSSSITEMKYETLVFVEGNFDVIGLEKRISDEATERFKAKVSQAETEQTQNTDDRSV